MEDVLGEMPLIASPQDKRFKCQKCDRKFTLSSNLTRHMRHNKICGVSEGFKCKNCNKVFSLNATMKDHYQRCVAEDPYRFSCPNCTKQFTFKSSLNKHLKGRCRTMKKQKAPRRDIQMYSCQFCAAEFYDVFICQKHENSGTCKLGNITESYICAYCGKSFTMKSSLKKHLQGRCKLMKPEAEDSVQRDSICVIQQGSNSNNDAEIEDEIEAVEIYEAWFETDDVIEECEEEDDGIDTEHVESYIEICNERDKNYSPTAEATKDSSNLPEVYTIKNEI